MKKIILTLLAVVALVASCSKKSVSEEDLQTFNTAAFSICIPMGWDTLINGNSYWFNSETQIFTIASLKSDIELDTFVAQRIAFFEENYRGFQLVKLDKKSDNEVVIYYENHDHPDEHPEDNLDVATCMRVIRQGELLYGVDCSYSNSAEKDTAMVLINSIKFN